MLYTRVSDPVPYCGERRSLRRYTILLRNLLLAIYIDLRKLYTTRLGFLLGERVEHGRDGLAGAAPVGVEIDDCVRRRGHELVEV
jgi:hypothetical protein